MKIIIFVLIIFSIIIICLPTIIKGFETTSQLTAKRSIDLTMEDEEDLIEGFDARSYRFRNRRNLENTVVTRDNSASATRASGAAAGGGGRARGRGRGRGDGGRGVPAPLAAMTALPAASATSAAPTGAPLAAMTALPAASATSASPIGASPTSASATELDADTLDKIDWKKAVNNYDVEYHDPSEEIARRNINGLPPDIVWVFDPKVNKKVAIKRPAMQNSVTYYEPGTYKYGGANYTPTYTESVLLSNTNQYFVNTE